MIARFERTTSRGWPWLLLFNLILFTPGMLAANLLAQSSLEHPPGILMGASDEGFRYMSGGIGLEERKIMLSWEADYSLKLAFAELSGDYLSDVKVLVADQNGEAVLSMITNGPWLYVKLPPGTFDVKATFEGETRQIENLYLRKGDRVTRLLHWDLEEQSQPVGD